MKDYFKIKRYHRKKRHRRVRSKIDGSEKIPRLSVYRSNKGYNLQLIDDTQSKVLISVNTNKKIKDLVKIKPLKEIIKKMSLSGKIQVKKEKI